MNKIIKSTHSKWPALGILAFNLLLLVMVFSSNANLQAQTVQMNTGTGGGSGSCTSPSPGDCVADECNETPTEETECTLPSEFQS